MRLLWSFMVSLQGLIHKAVLVVGCLLFLFRVFYFPTWKNKQTNKEKRKPMSKAVPLFASYYLWPWFRFLRYFPFSSRSFWSAPRITTSGRVQHQKLSIHGLPFLSSKYDWLNEYSAHAQKIGSSHMSRFLVVTKMIASYGDKNVYFLVPTWRLNRVGKRIH